MESIASLEKPFSDQPAGTENMLIDCAQSAIRHQLAQHRHIRKIHETADCPVMTLPFRFTNDMTLEQIKEMSVALVPADLMSPEFQSEVDSKWDHL
jgi:hypothetical protein